MEVSLETRISALEKDVKLNIKESIIAFKRLKDVELHIERIERDYLIKQNRDKV